MKTRTEVPGWRRAARLPVALRRILFLVALAGISLSASSAHAYVWMIRHGFSECGGCHVDPMGGETLTGMGRVTGQTLASSDFGAKEDPNDLALFAYGVPEPDYVRLGGSFRFLGVHDTETNNTAAFPMQMDFYGAVYVGRFVLAGSIGASRASQRLYEHTGKALLAGDLEGGNLVAVSRNHWLGYRFTDDLLIRVGRLNLPYGIRTPDHTMWVREDTETDRESDQLHGLGLAYTSGKLRGEIMGSAGNLQVKGQRFREYGYVGSLEVSLLPELAVGVSSLLLGADDELLFDGRNLDVGNAAAATEGVLRQAHGATLRYVPFKELVVLGEFNVTKRSRSGFGHVSMASFDYEPLRGFHLALTGEMLNRGTPERLVEEDRIPAGRGDTRLGVWLTANWFLFPHMDLRLDVVAREQRPTMLQAQFHFYL